MTAQVSSVQAASHEEPILENPPVRTVRTYVGVEELPVAYRRLFDEAQSGSFFYSLPWYRNLVRTALDTEEQVRILGVELNDGKCTPVAALPLRCERRPYNGWTLRTLSSSGATRWILRGRWSDVQYPMGDRTVPPGVVTGDRGRAGLEARRRTGK